MACKSHFIHEIVHELMKMTSHYMASNFREVIFLIMGMTGFFNTMALTTRWIFTISAIFP